MDRAATLPPDLAPDLPSAPVGPEAFREGMALLAGAVNIVTCRGDAAGPAGFTATAVCSVAAQPPTLLVCLNNGSSAAAAFGRAETLCVNTLAADQAAIARTFGGKTDMAGRFAAGQWQPGRLGDPVLQGALVAFETRIRERHPAGTHQVLICEIMAIHPGTPAAGACTYWNRAFHSLTTDQDG